MENIYSNIESNTLLATIVRLHDFDKPRTEIVSEIEFLQGAAIRVNEGDKFRPHRHIWKPFFSFYGENKTMAQECWIVMRGVIKIVIYDFDDKVIHETELRDHDAVFLLHGGHSFQCLEDHTFMWELKTGPYEGQAKDKVFIKNNGE
jgi:hypothetical protein